MVDFTLVIHSPMIQPRQILEREHSESLVSRPLNLAKSSTTADHNARLFSAPLDVTTEHSSSSTADHVLDEETLRNWQVSGSNGLLVVD
jgi:hypothetical protein